VDLIGSLEQLGQSGHIAFGEAEIIEIDVIVVINADQKGVPLSGFRFLSGQKTSADSDADADKAGECEDAGAHGETSKLVGQVIPERRTDYTREIVGS
jgi:hypothetical protein